MSVIKKAPILIKTGAFCGVVLRKKLLMDEYYLNIEPNLYR
jgi:hypothetical protein